jgi:hypothetical protein
MPLTPYECELIVTESIRQTAGFTGLIVPSMRLQHVGIYDMDRVYALVDEIAYSKTHGVQKYGMRLDLNALSEILPTTQIGTLRDLITVSALPGGETFPDE